MSRERIKRTKGRRRKSGEMMMTVIKMMEMLIIPTEEKSLWL